MDRMKFNIEIVTCPVCLKQFNMAWVKQGSMFRDSAVCPHCNYELIKENVRDVQKDIKTTQNSTKNVKKSHLFQEKDSK